MGWRIEGNKGYHAAVDKNEQLHTFSVTETEAEQAIALGNGYNINSGKVNLTSDANHAVLYFKNNEARTFHIEAIAVGINSAGTVSDVSEITLVRNPTGGTIIDNATAADMVQNRNFGSSNTLADSLSYKGANGYTLTGGNDIALFFAAEGSRLYANIDFEVPTGSAIGIEVDPNWSTSGTVVVYAALIGYLKDLNNEDT